MCRKFAPATAAAEATPAEPEEDFLEFESERQPAAIAPVAAAAGAAAVVSATPGAELVAPAEPVRAAEASALPDDAAVDLAEQIVDRVLARLRPELVKEVARLLN